MGSTNSLQDRYNDFLREVYKDILKKEGFTRKHGKFVCVANGIIWSVEFHSCFYRNDKKKDTLGFSIYVEARLEHEVQLRRDNRLISGKGAYFRAFPNLPKRNKWNGRLEYSEEDLKLIECFQIQKHTDLAWLKEIVKKFLDEALVDIMRFRTEADLIDHLNMEYREGIKANVYRANRHTLLEFFIYGVLGIIACFVIGDGFPLTFVSMVYYDIVTNGMELSDRWFRRMLSVPIAELLVSMTLCYLLWAKLLRDDHGIGLVCIGLFFSGLVNLVLYIYNRYGRKQRKELLNNRRFWGGA